jgi:hypothetical protein
MYVYIWIMTVPQAHGRQSAGFDYFCSSVLAGAASTWLPATAPSIFESVRLGA